VTTISFRSEAFARGARMLRTALGPAISSYLGDPSIVCVQGFAWPWSGNGFGIGGAVFLALKPQ
jgi:hypothetical protein